MLEIKNIFVTFGGIKALKNISYSFPKNVNLGIIGTNGAGKTTLINVITGNVKIKEGEVWYDKKNITNLDTYKICDTGIYRTFQTPLLYNSLSVLENIILGYIKELDYNLKIPLKRIEEEKKEEIISLLNKLNLDQKILSKRPNELPYGIKRFVEIIRVLLLKPKLILFDEATSGLNKKEISNFRQLLLSVKEERKIDYIFIEHNLDFIFSITDSIIMMDKGQIIFQGNKKELLINKPQLKKFIKTNE